MSQNLYSLAKATMLLFSLYQLHHRRDLAESLKRRHRMQQAQWEASSYDEEEIRFSPRYFAVCWVTKDMIWVMAIIVKLLCYTKQSPQLCVLTAQALRCLHFTLTHR
jgi:hypothetical protein